VGEFKELLKYWTEVRNNYNGCNSFGCWGEVSVLPGLWTVAGGKRDMVYVDVGANKGESLSTVLKYWIDIGEHFVMEKSAKGPACSFDPTTPIIYALEPLPANIKLLYYFKTKMPQTVQKNLNVVHAAVGNVDGQSCFKADDFAGNERGFLNGTAANGCGPGTVPVSQVTLSKWVEDNSISHIDYLKIDVEGFDANVIHGAAGMLRKGVVDMLSFEYHELNLWRSQESLKGISEELDSWGYDTYYIGDFHLYRLNNGCWDNIYERRQWSNILAIRKTYVKHVDLLKQFHRTSCQHRPLKPLCNRFRGRIPTVPW
jgi:FkbM family methyltransferase